MYRIIIGTEDISSIVFNVMFDSDFSAFAFIVG